MLVAAVGVLAGAERAAAAQLVLPASSLRGFESGSVSRGAVVADLARGLPRGLGVVVAGAEVQGSVLVSRSARLRSEAFVFDSGRAAERVLAAWGRVRRAHRVSVGVSGYASAGRARILVAWREGARIGVVALTGSRGVRASGAQALGYAVLADGWLRSPLPTSAWQRVLDQIRPDGSVSKRTALEAFAVAFGPLPGVPAPVGRRSVVQSGTLAEQWILSYWRELTAGQRRVVERRLGIRAARSSPARAAKVSPPVFFPDDPGFKADPAIQALADKYAGIYRTRLGHVLSLKVVAGATSTNLPDYGITDAVGSPLVCRVRIPPAGQQAPTQQSVEFVPPLDLIVAHEVFHCFQGDITGWKKLPAWISEGMADWAALTVDPVAFFHGGGNLKTYITTPHTALFQRSYDAVGFWGHAEDVVANQWASIPAILNVGSDSGAFYLAGGDDDAFLSGWGSSVFRLNCCGYLPWQMQSPITPPSLVQLPGGEQKVDLLAMPSVPVDAPPLTTAQYKVLGGPSEPVVHVAITGHARLSEHYNYTSLTNAWFCLGAAPCECPKDTEGQVPATLPLGSVSAFPLGLSGDPGTGAHGELSAYPLSHFCQPKVTPPGNGNPGTSNGDPYITTFDHGDYGFQLAGEFTLVKSTVDDLEIQSRQVPYRFVLGWGGNSLAMNTAFAIRDGGTIVEVEKGSPLVLYIDRHRRAAHAGELIGLPGGGAVRYSNAKVTVSWPDGTTATVLSIGSEGVNIFVRPSAGRAGHLRGLMGSDDGNLADDFIGRDGKRYDPRKIQSVGLFAGTRAEVRILLGGFGRSWRITQAESLFVYPPGKSTRSYLVPGFPSALLSVRSVPRPRLIAGARECHRAGVTNPALLAGCELDYGASGDPRLASATGTLQHAGGLPPSRVDLSGRWSGQYGGAFNGTFTLTWTQSGSRLTGTIKLSNPRDTLGIRGTVTGTGIRFGSVGFATYSGSVYGNVMSGHYDTPRGGGSWNAAKIP